MIAEAKAARSKRRDADAGRMSLFDLEPDYDDLETGVHVYQRKTGWWDAALLRLPESVRFL